MSYVSVPRDAMTASVRVRNNSTRAGVELVQVYVED
jgi:hypothetical protein